MRFVHRQPSGPAVDLPRAGEDDFDFWIAGAAGFEDRELRLAIDLEVRHRIRHRVEVAGLAGEIEKEILVLDEMAQAMSIADVGDVDLDAVANVFDVVTVSAV